MFAQYPDLTVVAAGLHGVVERAGLPHGADEEHGGQEPTGFKACAQIFISKPGVLGKKHGGGVFQKEENEPVGEHNKLD